jgi:hypothetical protein
MNEALVVLVCTDRYIHHHTTHTYAPGDFLPRMATANTGSTGSMAPIVTPARRYLSDVCAQARSCVGASSIDLVTGS